MASTDADVAATRVTQRLGQALGAGGTTAQDALWIYDQLDPPELDSMIGTWKGAGFRSQHPLDGLLEAVGWYGKHFAGRDQVHPLLFYGANRRVVFPVNPALAPRDLRLAGGLGGRGGSLHWLVLAARPLIRTGRYTARLRLTEYRGKLCPTMIYDDLPIHDVFRRVDDRTVLGAMDMRGLEQPFFFVLRRDASVTIR